MAEPCSRHWQTLTRPIPARAKVKEVKERCSKEIDWPLMEEYDFRNDTSNPELPIELKSDTAIREYQSKVQLAPRACSLAHLALSRSLLHSAHRCRTSS